MASYLFQIDQPVWHQILSYLSGKQLCVLERVCQYWRLSVPDYCKRRRNAFHLWSDVPVALETFAVKWAGDEILWLDRWLEVHFSQVEAFTITVTLDVKEYSGILFTNASLCFLTQFVTFRRQVDTLLLEGTPNWFSSEVCALLGCFGEKPFQVKGIKKFELVNNFVPAHCGPLHSFIADHQYTLQEFSCDILGEALYQILDVLLHCETMRHLKLRISGTYPADWAVYSVCSAGHERASNLKSLHIYTVDKPNQCRLYVYQLESLISLCPLLESLILDHPVGAKELQCISRWEKLTSVHFAVSSSQWGFSTESFVEFLVSKGHQLLDPHKQTERNCIMATYRMQGGFFQEFGLRATESDICQFLVPLARHLPVLEILDLSECCDIGVNTVKYLVQSCPSLTKLILPNKQLVHQVACGRVSVVCKKPRHSKTPDLGTRGRVLSVDKIIQWRQSCYTKP